MKYTFIYRFYNELTRELRVFKDDSLKTFEQAEVTASMMAKRNEIVESVRVWKRD